MNTLITFKNGRVDFIKVMEQEKVTPPKQAAEMIKSARCVCLDLDNREYMKDVLVELGCTIYALELEFVRLAPQFGGNEIYGAIHDLKRVSAWLEMQSLSARRKQYLTDNA